MEPTSEFLELFRASRRPTAKHDTYFAVYDELFAPYKGRDITFVEIGIMGGGSLEAWRKYFGPKSRIIGIDLNPLLREELAKDGFEVFIGDQADPAFWRKFFEDVGKVDILLDDGGHTNAQMWQTLTSALDNVNDGGLIVTEDTHASYMRSFGNPSSNSYVAKLALVIDAINYRSSSIDSVDRRAGRRAEVARALSGTHLERSVHSVRFFESIVALYIDSRKCVPSKTAAFGHGDYPEDFRYKGIRESLSERFMRRLRAGIRKIQR